MHLADLVDHAGVEKHTLRERCFARVNVGTDPDIAGALQWVLAVWGIRVGHGNFEET